MQAGGVAAPVASAGQSGATSFVSAFVSTKGIASFPSTSANNVSSGSNGTGFRASWQSMLRAVGVEISSEDGAINAAAAHSLTPSGFANTGAVTSSAVTNGSAATTQLLQSTQNAVAGSSTLKKIDMQIGSLSASSNLATLTKFKKTDAATETQSTQSSKNVKSTDSAPALSAKAQAVAQNSQLPDPAPSATIASATIQTATPAQLPVAKAETARTQASVLTSSHADSLASLAADAKDAVAANQITQNTQIAQPVASTPLQSSAITTDSSEKPIDAAIDAAEEVSSTAAKTELSNSSLAGEATDTRATLNSAEGRKTAVAVASNSTLTNTQSIHATGLSRVVESVNAQSDLDEGSSSDLAAADLSQTAKTVSAAAGNPSVTGTGRGLRAVQLNAAASNMQPNADGVYDPAPTDAVAANLSVTANTTVTQQAATRVASHSGSSASETAAAHTANTQTTAAGIDASAWMREPSGAYAASPAASSGTFSSSSSGSAAGTSDPFAALDSASSVGAPSWVRASSQHAEAGFQDPTLGWVAVRADLSGGNVHASLVAGSADAAQTLNTHMAGLNSYLNEQQTHIATLTVDSSGANSSGAGWDQSMQQGANQNSSQQSSSGASAGLESETTAARPEANHITAASETVITAYTGGTSGRYISVMA
jgi:hypothetical protein